MRYARSVLVTLATKGIALPIGILSSVLTARYLGPEGRGILAVLLVLQGFAIQFGTVGFNASVTYFTARERSAQGTIVTLALLAAASAGIALSILLYIVRIVRPDILLGTIDPRYLDIFLLSLPFVLLAQFVQNILVAQNRIPALNALDLFTRILQLAMLALILIVLGLSVYETVVGLVVVAVVSAIISVSRVFENARWRLPVDWLNFLRGMMRYGLKTYAASFFMFMVLRINLLLINALLDEQAAGIYSITAQIADLAYLVPMTFGMLLFPRVSAGDPQDASLSVKAFRFTLVLMGATSIGLLLFGESIIHLLYGDDFLGAVEPLLWLLPGIVALSLVMILNNDLAGRGLPPVVIIAPVVGLAVNIVLNLLLLPVYGLSGSSFSSSTAHIIMFLILFASFTRSLRISLRAMLVPSRRDFNLRSIFR